MFPLKNIISIHADTFGDISDMTCERLREMFYIHFTLGQMFTLKKLPQDQLTLPVPQGSFQREQAGIGLVPPPLPLQPPSCLSPVKTH